jgi:HNH endonuclease
MAFWIFKVSDGGTYPDVRGKLYVYDNTHSVRVKGGDEFIYLEKKGAKYGLSGAGRVSKVSAQAVKSKERRRPKVTKIFSAHLSDVVWFSEFFDLSSRTDVGAKNRAQTGLPSDLNEFGWSISMPQISQDLFVMLLDTALASGPSAQASAVPITGNFHVDDAWCMVRKRVRLHVFRSAVFLRHKSTCLICGCRLKSVLEVAHIRSYAIDHDNRANPGNGICLCRFCHAAFDAGDVILQPDGELAIVQPMDDPIAIAHFTAIPGDVRKTWMTGIEMQFLVDRPGVSLTGQVCGRPQD